MNHCAPWRRLSAAVVLVGSVPALGQLTLESQFATGLSHVGLGAGGGDVWVYQDFGSLLRRYSPSGTLLASLTRPGGSANDADVEVAPVDMSLAGVPVPAGSVLYIDGESGVAEVYAVDPATGTVIATLVTQFGVSHVVGGAYHPQRGTLFLVQDRVPGGAAANRIAEVDAATGAVLSSWVTTATRPTFTVNYGDLDVAPNGNLFIVSSDELSIGEFTPEGAFVQEHAYPTGVSSVCGIGVDQATCTVWVASTSSTVWRLGLPASQCLVPCAGGADFDGDGDIGTDADIEAFFACLAGNCCATCGTSDFNGDGDVGTDADIESFFRVLAGGPC
jgi:hypothetical protein